MMLRALGPVAFLIAVAALVPLRQVLPADFSAANASGTVWNGRITSARWQGVNLGSFNIGLRLAPLLLGEARLAVDGPDLSGGVILGQGVEALTGRRMVAGLPINSLAAQDLTLLFKDGQCASASGTVAASLQANGEVLSGTPRCIGNAAAVSLASADGLTALTLTLSAGGQMSFAP